MRQSMTQGARFASAHRSQVDEPAENRVRDVILSPKEQKAIALMFKHYGRSVTQLAGIFNATEAAIQNVIRPRVVVVPPQPQDVKVMKAAA